MGPDLTTYCRLNSFKDWQLQVAVLVATVLPATKTESKRQMKAKWPACITHDFCICMLLLTKGITPRLQLPLAVL